MYVSAHPSLDPGYLIRQPMQQQWISVDQSALCLSCHWGRDALWLIGRALAQVGKTMLLPSYLCQSVIEPVKQSGCFYSFYRITQALEIDEQDIETQLSRGAGAVLLIHYNGILQKNLSNLVKICQRFGALLIEDCSECLFDSLQNEPGSLRGHLSIYNYRKWLPVPDGAIIVVRDATLLSAMDSEHRPQSKTNLPATVDLLQRFVRSQSPLGNRWPVREICLGLSRHVKAMRASYPYGGYTSGRLTRALLKRLSPLEIVQSRCRNYVWLREQLLDLRGFTLFSPPLEEGVVPRGLAILLEQRNNVLSWLARYDIEVSVRWPLPAEVARDKYADAHWIADRILVLPCHQDLEQRHLLAMLIALTKSLRIG